MAHETFTSRHTSHAGHRGGGGEGWVQDSLCIGVAAGDACPSITCGPCEVQAGVCLCLCKWMCVCVCVLTTVEH